jgi:hypothetical protein
MNKLIFCFCYVYLIINSFLKVLVIAVFCLYVNRFFIQDFAVIMFCFVVANLFS